MKSKFLWFVFCILLCSFAVAKSAAGQTKISVAGVVVDETGSRVQGALVSLYTPLCKRCYDDLVPSFRTGQEGVFFLNTYATSSVARIIVEGPVPLGYRNILGPVDLKLKSFPEFQGIAIKRSDGVGTIQLGEVLPTVTWRPVSIDVAQLFHLERNLLRDDLKLTLSVEHHGVRVINSRPAGQPEFDRVTGKLNFAIPVGKWRFIVEAKSSGKRQEESISIDVR